MIHVGVAGWDYPDWKGVVYPAAGTRGFDRLAYLAGFVDVVEINSSFYRPIDPAVSASWLRRVATRPGFRFTAKAHRAFTHEPDAEPGAVGAASLRGLRPLREAGVLGALLLQFPQSFHRTPHALVRLEALLRALSDWPVVVEVRHASWDRCEAADWLRARGAGWCVVDQPAIGRSTATATPRVTSPVAYLRLHGRNAADWFREDAGRDARYDYLYGEDELRSLAEVAREISRPAAVTFVVQNNHFRGQALVNALQLRGLLGGTRPTAPAELVARYPELAAYVSSPPRLF